MSRKTARFFFLSAAVHAVVIFFFIRIPISRRVVFPPAHLILPVKIVQGGIKWSGISSMEPNVTAMSGRTVSEFEKPFVTPKKTPFGVKTEQAEEFFADNGTVSLPMNVAGADEGTGGNPSPSILDAFALPDASATVKQMYDARVWPKAPFRAKKNQSMVVHAIVPPDLKLWARRVVRRIRENWNLPPGFTGRGQTGVTLRFTVDRQGRIEKVALFPGLAAEDFQEKALNALHASSPLPPLPTGYRRDRLELELVLATK